MKKAMLISAAAIAAGCLTTFVAQAKPEQYLILSKNNKFPDQFETSIGTAGGEVLFKIDAIGVAAAVSEDPNFSVKASVISELEAVVPDLPVGLAKPMATAGVNSELTLPSLSVADLSGLQWSLDAIQAPDAWETGARGAGVRVFVLDAGIDLAHADLLPNLNLELSRSFCDEPLQYQPGGPIPFAHGSATAGIIAGANSGAGIVGVAPEAEIVHVKVLQDATGGGSSAMLIWGIYYAAINGADVINMSLGGYYTQSGWVINPANPSRSFFVGAKAIAAHVNAHKWAADYAHWLGATLIASAGNNAINRDQVADLICLPGDLPKVIQVSATGPNGRASNPGTNLDLPAPYTDYGQSAIDLAAPGGFSPQPHPTRAYWPLDYSVNTPDWAFDLVLVADHDSGWSWVSGTSFAAPHVAGVAALVIGVNGGSMHPDQVRTILEQSSDDLGKPGKDDFYGAGRVNALRAVLSH